MGESSNNEDETKNIIILISDCVTEMVFRHVYRVSNGLVIL